MSALLILRMWAARKFIQRPEPREVRETRIGIARPRLHTRRREGVGFTHSAPRDNRLWNFPSPFPYWRGGEGQAIEGCDAVFHLSLNSATGDVCVLDRGQTRVCRGDAEEDDEDCKSRMRALHNRTMRLLR